MSTKLIQKPNAEAVPDEVIAQSLVEISAGMKRMRDGKLSNKAWLVLLKHSTGETFETLENVIKGIDNLSRDYVKTEARK